MTVATMYYWYDSYDSDSYTYSHSFNSCGCSNDNRYLYQNVYFGGLCCSYLELKREPRKDLQFVLS